MNNSKFISRCETILATMKGEDIFSVTSKQITDWLNVDEASVSAAVASQTIQKACQYNILKKVGAASKTKYQLTFDCINFLKDKWEPLGVNAAVKCAVKHFMTHSPKKIDAEEIITENGKRLVKIKSTQELDEEAGSAINQLMTLVNQNKDLRVEIELLKEENGSKDETIESLKAENEYLKNILTQIKSLTNDLHARRV